MSVYDEIRAERARQDEQWGGADHDDHHLAPDWLDFIERQTGRLRAGFWSNALGGVEYRDRLLKVVALAVAAIESYDRNGHARGIRS